MVSIPLPIQEATTGTPESCSCLRSDQSWNFLDLWQREKR
ncbi:hypothetical protein SLEP1_g38053 [Rubroshorea leprosula]|uniref:Uncharacterized protein n=1 Tax=Rubroshorea leprosula TaxID=152421 RepID=A0AAV5KWY5_9ROSI|nr:hypothetical protein SLEP1_g38053 [Rubroshorea leprosula]